MMKKLFAVAAICGTTLSPIMSTAALAATTLVDPIPAANPGATVLPGMQATCDAAAAVYGTNVDGADKWTGTVVLGDVTLSAGPSEVGTHSKADAVGTIVGGGTFTPAHLEILGDPFRNGGSVNMFGIQQSVGGHYSLAQYDFMGSFKTTYSHAFSCQIYKSTFHKGAHHDAVDLDHPAIGRYVIYNEFGNSNDATRQECEAFSAQQPADPLTGPLSPTWWGELYHGGNTDPDSNGFKPHCIFQGTAAWHEHHDAYDDPDTYDAPELMYTEAQTAVLVDQTDTLKAHEDADPAGLDTSETLLIGQVVVCISPSTTTKKLPGAWTAKNGYTGTKCTTDWYNTGATVGVPNLNDGSHNWVTVPLS